VDFADLVIVDLHKYATPEGRTELAAQVFNAMSTVGFFYVVNHGYSQAQVRERKSLVHSVRWLILHRQTESSTSLILPSLVLISRRNIVMQGV
jgi:hypothetical protein